MPFFSVVIPSYNISHLIKRAIDSLLNQTFQDFEIIIVDDGSTDNSRLLIESIESNKIKYIFQENQGVCTARNKGVSFSKGDYIAFLDSDDYVLYNWLEDFNAVIQKKTPDFVFCNMKVINLKDNLEKIVSALYPYDEKEYTEDGLFLAGTFCVKREVFISLGRFDNQLKFGEFTEFRIRVFLNNYKKEFTNKVAFVYETSTNGGNNNLTNKIDSNLYVIKKHKSYFDKHPRDLVNYLNISATAAIKKKDFKLANQLFFWSFKIKPFKLKALLRCLFSYNEFLSRVLWK